MHESHWSCVFVRGMGFLLLGLKYNYSDRDS